MQDITLTQRMRELRTRLAGKLTYRYDAAEEGTASWLDVSRVGAKLRLGRYLRPGRLIELEFASPLEGDDLVRVHARVIWCEQAKDSAEFVAGVHVRRETPEAALAFAALSYQQHGTVQSANTPEGSGVGPNVWPHFHALGSKEGQAATASVREAV